MKYSRFFLHLLIKHSIPIKIKLNELILAIINYKQIKNNINIYLFKTKSIYYRKDKNYKTETTKPKRTHHRNKKHTFKTRHYRNRLY